MAATESSTRANRALDDLYRHHVGEVYRYTYAVLGNHADAEDVTQTTFVNALRALERGETPRDPSHWLIAIAHNLVRQRWRQAAARPAMVELVGDVPDEAPEEDVRLDELVRALQRIPPSQREALVMRELEGRSYREIAELLGLTTGALETLLFRARRSLAEELENIVTCQAAELSLSRQSDGRLSRKERKRLDAHVAECPSCAKFARSAAWQRKAFKGLAVLPLPIGLSLFRDVPVAAAANVTPIGEAASAAATGTATGGGAAGGTATAGGAVAGGSLLGGAAVKIAAIAAVAAVTVGVAYEGIKAVREVPASARVAAGQVCG
jgi:RNA polymerase sigma factor (sigma-70 family)